MKKNYFITAIGALCFSLNAMAQVNNQEVFFNADPHPDIIPAAPYVNQQTPSKVNSTTSVWLSYYNSVKKSNNITPVIGYSFLFPDSLVRIKDFGGNIGRPPVHMIGNLFDIKSSYYQNQIQTNSFSTFTVDSISVEYLYKRKTASSVKDTLYVYMFVNSLSNLGLGSFPNQMANYGADTVFFRTAKYTFGTNSPNATNLIINKIPLGDADTSKANAVKHKDIKINLNVAANGLVFCALSFKPGFTYNTNDTISKNKNIFAFVSYEERGLNTYPSYKETHKWNFLNADWSQSYIVPSSVRYNNNPNGWNGNFIPTYGFNKAYGLENHGIWYKITSTNVGVKELSENGYSLGQNTPNPFTGQTTIVYELAKDAKGVKLEVYDVTGRTVYAAAQPNTAGSHSTILSNLKSGMYFYSLQVDGNIITKKMLAE